MTVRRLVAAMVLALLPVMMMAAQGDGLLAPEAAFAAYLGWSGMKAFLVPLAAATMCSIGGPAAAIGCGFTAAL